MPLQYDVLEPGLALSGAPRCASDLDAMPFTGILNLCDFHPPRYGRGLRSDIALVRRPVNDIFPIPLPYLALAVLELAELRRQGRTTLVHCHAGRSRSPSVVALYWMARDGLSWAEAMARVLVRRDVASPNRYFETDQRRAEIVEPARQLLAGDDGVLASARQNREDLIRTFQDREPDTAGPDDDWNRIDGGFVLGSLVSGTAGLSDQGISDAAVAGRVDQEQLSTLARSMPDARVHRLPLGDDGGLIEAADAVTAIRNGLAPGRSLALLSVGDEYAGMLVACATIMRERAWDIATAMWFVGSRRASLWSHVGALWARTWDSQPNRT